MLNRAAIPPVKAAASSPVPGNTFKDPCPSRKQILEHTHRSGERYDKRPRHKTKPDKYDVKAGSKPQDTGKGDVIKKKSSKRQRRKSGLILNKEFKAPNVAQDRLTLSANGGLGIFRKGKASSPVRKSGLPDLSFSEMSFLCRRQDRDEVQQQNPKEKYCKNNKDKTVTQHISEYFERRPAAQPDEEPTSAAILHGQTAAYKPITSSKSSSSTKQRAEESPEASSRLDLRHSPPKNDNAAPVARKYWISEVEQPRIELYRPRSTPAAQRQQSSGLASHHSWSVTTPSQRSRNPKVAEDVYGNAAQISRPQGQHLDEQRCPRDIKYSTIQREDRMASNSAHERSLSELSGDGYTASMMLGFKSDSWNHIPTQKAAAELYTLADLKNLSRLERLSVHQKETSSLRNAHRRPSLPCHEPAADSRLGQVNVSELDTNPGQGGLFNMQPSAKTDHQPLPMPQTLMRTTKTGRNKLPFQPVAQAGNCTDPPLFRNLNLSPASHQPKLAPANVESIVVPNHSQSYSSFERRHSNNHPGAVASVAVLQPALHHCKDFSEQRKYSLSNIENAQRIIHDIEEEALGNWSSKHRDSLFDNLADVAVQSFYDPLSRQEIFDGYSPRRDYDALLPQTHAPSFDQVQGDQHQPYSAANLEQIDRGYANARADGAAAHVRDTAQPGPASCRNDLTQQQGQQKEEEGACFTDFWRPNILY